MKKIKDFFKCYLPGFLLGIISACTISVIAATYFPSNDVTYDNTESGLSSTDVQGAIDELYGVCFPSAADQIIEDAGLEKDPYECRYFFTGANPNNYITFNDETAGWRILSVECDGTIKIMKNESIGSIKWDNSSSVSTVANNNWTRPASLNTYLNTEYYNSIIDNSQQQITKHNFNIGVTSKQDSNLSDTITNESSKKWSGNIGLISISEYIRANSNKNNCGTILLNNVNVKTCIETNWIYMLVQNRGYFASTITANIDENTDILGFSTFPGAGGSVSSYYSGDTSLTIPTLYLKSEIQIIRGTGTKSDPYELSL